MNSLNALVIYLGDYLSIPIYWDNIRDNIITRLDSMNYT